MQLSAPELEDQLKSLLAELGITEKSAIEAVARDHIELFEAFRAGTITYAALRHCLARQVTRAKYAG